jgi:hypothetical protein
VTAVTAVTDAGTGGSVDPPSQAASNSASAADERTDGQIFMKGR